MHDELNALFWDARNESLTPSEFRERLEALHQRYFGVEADSRELVTRRLEAGAAYDEFRGTLERHHAVERLAHALGLNEA